ncbi:hypothetical protein [Mycobacterium persicum]|uniref:hypothetical protein n=1 Tax=Mycobacterium persicum TaxID=1487726 RepID=UPI001F07227D|nr:hypothetical protein [Mycobacterium persicum]
MPVYTQDQLRDRRRAGLVHTYGGQWSLTAEVAALYDPLARRVAAAPNPAGYWRSVDDVALAVHGLVHAVVGLLAECDAQRRTKHLGVDVRGRSIRALVDLAERPKLPEIGDEALVSGTWPATLMLLAEPYAAELAELLGNALTTAVSDRLYAALRDVDRAALALERRLDRDQQARAAKPTKTTPTETDRARAELAALGIT